VMRSPGLRMLSMLVIPFSLCSARLNVFIFMTTALFSPHIAPVVLFSLYLFSPSIRFQFTSNAAGQRLGVFATVTLDVTSSSGSPSQSASSRGSLVNSGSMRVSSSVTASATSSSTVFYKGNWTDLGQLNYAMSDIAPGNLGGLTISQCQMRCWLNSECAVIVVSSPCNTIALDSPQVNTVACGSCWLKLNYGWTISADAVSRSMFMYERMYPPTTTAAVSWRTSSLSCRRRADSTCAAYSCCPSKASSALRR
jgi:hypothetical protein